jgi:histidine ammonia-lyase
MNLDFSNAETVELSGHGLTTEIIHHVAHARPGQVELKLGEGTLPNMQRSRDFILDIVKKGKPVYGINTGFGALSSKQIPEKDLKTLQLNLIRSHCTGVGAPFEIPVVRAIMVLRANCLISGFSGVNPEVVQLLLDFINFNITPIVPQKGSVGASGDLAPLSHIALALIGEGHVIFEGKEVSSEFAINQIGKSPIVLGPKDGLALINGTAVMAALGSLAFIEADRLFKLADVSSSLTLDGLKGSIRAYHPFIQSLKPHPGQLASSINIRKILEGSEIIDSHEDCGKVQDPYSLRCVPQVHGAARQTLRHLKEVLDIEINSVTDNPLCDVSEGLVLSGGNFHGEAIALAMDYAAMGLAEIANISERRIEKMMNPTFSDLPAFLVEDSGLNSGLMITHVTAAALVSENKILCHPASVDSVPTSTDKEDHVSMGVTSGRKLLEVLDNVKHVLCIEFLCASQAMEFHRPLKSSDCIENLMSLIRKHIEPIKNDRVFAKDIQSFKNLIESNELLNSIESIIGELK